MPSGSVLIGPSQPAAEVELDGQIEIEAESAVAGTPEAHGRPRPVRASRMAQAIAARHRLGMAGETALAAMIERILDDPGGRRVVEDRPETAFPPIDGPPSPAVHPALSIGPDFLICLEDGAPFRNLARHLMLTYKLSPEAYRRRWGLPPDYPMKPVQTPEQRRDLIQRLSGPGGAAPVPAACSEHDLQIRIMRARRLGLPDGEIVDLLLAGTGQMARLLDAVDDTLQAIDHAKPAGP